VRVSGSRCEFDALAGGDGAAARRAESQTRRELARQIAAFLGSTAMKAVPSVSVDLTLTTSTRTHCWARCALTVTVPDRDRLRGVSQKVRNQCTDAIAINRLAVSPYATNDNMQALHDAATPL
jgi:hypothetical protein